MNTHTVVTPFWSTASFDDAADGLSMELSALAEHLNLCNGSLGRLFALQCIADTMKGFLAGRFVTTVVVVALLIGVASLAL